MPGSFPGSCVLTSPPTSLTPGWTLQVGACLCSPSPTLVLPSSTRPGAQHPAKHRLLKQPKPRVQQQPALHQHRLRVVHAQRSMTPGFQRHQPQPLHPQGRTVGSDHSRTPAFHRKPRVQRRTRQSSWRSCLSTCGGHIVGSLLQDELASLEPLRGMHPETLGQLAAGLKPRAVPAGHDVCRPGEPCACLWVLQRGGPAWVCRAPTLLKGLGAFGGKRGPVLRGGSHTGGFQTPHPMLCAGRSHAHCAAPYCSHRSLLLCMLGTALPATGSRLRPPTDIRAGGESGA